MYKRLRIFVLVLLLISLSVIGNGDLTVQCSGEDGHVAFERSFFSKCISSTFFAVRSFAQPSFEKAPAKSTYHCDNCIDIPLSFYGTVSKKETERGREIREVTPVSLPFYTVDSGVSSIFPDSPGILQPQSKPAMLLFLSTVIQLR